MSTSGLHNPSCGAKGSLSPSRASIPLLFQRHKEGGRGERREKGSLLREGLREVQRHPRRRGKSHWPWFPPITGGSERHSGRLQVHARLQARVRAFANVQSRLEASTLTANRPEAEDSSLWKGNDVRRLVYEQQRSLASMDSSAAHQWSVFTDKTSTTYQNPSSGFDCTPHFSANKPVTIVWCSVSGERFTIARWILADGSFKFQKVQRYVRQVTMFKPMAGRMFMRHARTASSGTHMQAPLLSSRRIVQSGFLDI